MLNNKSIHRCGMEKKHIAVKAKNLNLLIY